MRTPRIGCSVVAKRLSRGAAVVGTRNLLEHYFSFEFTGNASNFCDLKYEEILQEESTLRLRALATLRYKPSGQRHMIGSF